MIHTMATTPFNDQCPGTSGLRKKVRTFQQPNYLENFIQSIFDTQPHLVGGTLVLGGDGRFFNTEAIQIIFRLAAANRVKTLLVGQYGLLSTPASSCIIRQYQAQGGFILSASHNPAGADKDFGIKYNIANGGSATEAITEAIFQQSLTISRYLTTDSDDIDLSSLAHHNLLDMTIQVIDSVADYADLMQSLFDFELIKRFLSETTFTLAFDAMHAVTGPYARYIFNDLLETDNTTVINGDPKEDFAGGHPDPNPIHAHELVKLTLGEQGVDFAAASDGDGDRNMILGKNFFVTPSDSLAVLTANAHLIKGYQRPISGVARSMPTSQAVDQVAKHMGIPCYETPTGWKFFGNLLDHGKIVFCGEESFGTGSDHVREKDGLWAVLFWLNLLAIKQVSVSNILQAHWKTYGRNYYSRHDYESIETHSANQLMDHLQTTCQTLSNTHIQGLHITLADDFSYTDPIDNTVSSHQGIRLLFSNGSRIIFRLSGTGTQGATLRVYFEVYETNPDKQQLDIHQVMQPLVKIAQDIAKIKQFTGRDQPCLIT